MSMITGIMRSACIGAIVLAMPVCLVSADSITLVNGTTVQGRIVEETEAYVRFVDRAGYIEKYPRTTIQDITFEKGATMSQTQESPIYEITPDKATVPVPTQPQDLREHLLKTQAMIKETLERLDAMGEGEETPEEEKDLLKEERDKKYKKYEKYY
jgi:hypothetical protein